VSFRVRLTTINSVATLRHETKLVGLTDAVSVQAANNQTQMKLVERQTEDFSVLRGDVKSTNGNTLIIQDQLRELLGLVQQQRDDAVQLNGLPLRIRELEDRLNDERPPTSAPEVWLYPN
jgi:hypothetical protein